MNRGLAVPGSHRRRLVSSDAGGSVLQRVASDLFPNGDPNDLPEVHQMASAEQDRQIAS